MVIEYGFTAVGRGWMVCEESPTGFSRVYYITDGEVRYEDKYGIKKLKNGHIYFFPSTIPYKINHNPDKPLKCLFFHLIMSSNTINSLIEFDIEKSAFLFNLLSAMKYAVIDRNNLIVNEMSDILEIYCSQNNIIEKNLPESIEKILLYISENFKKEITLDNLSKIAGYQKEYFIRQFKGYLGISPYQYVKNLRLNEVTKLMKKNLSITEAAVNAGYSDIKNFTRAFKNKYGMTATEWKKQYKPLP